MLNVHLDLGKDRREAGDFIGAERVRKHLKEGPPRRRIGLIVDGAPARRTSDSRKLIILELIVVHRGCTNL